MSNKDLNRLKLVLVEQKRTANWLAAEIGKDPAYCIKVMYEYSTTKY